MPIPPPEDTNPNVSFERERGVYAIRVTRDVVHALVVVAEGEHRSAQIQQVFNVLTGADVSIFLIKLHRSAVTFALAGADLPNAETALSDAGLSSRSRKDLAVVSVVAVSMRQLSGIMAGIADALYTAGARLYATGDSHNSVQCLVEAERVPAAILSLCETFHLDSGAVSETSAEAEAGQ